MFGGKGMPDMSDPQTWYNNILARGLDLAYLATHRRNHYGQPLTIGSQARYDVEMRTVRAIKPRTFGEGDVLYYKARLIHLSTDETSTVLINWQIGNTLIDALEAVAKEMSTEVQRIEKKLRDEVKGFAQWLVTEGQDDDE